MTDINPISKQFLIEKAVPNEDGSVTFEGWISTPHEDLDHDEVPPSAFAGSAFTSYFMRGAPVSSEHGLKAYPIGHLQKAALVDNGSILQEESHPSDPQPFLSIPVGTGWYARGVLDASDAANAVRKGNVRSFSWIGNLAEFTQTIGGGRRFTRVDPIMETTVTAYPVNPKAVMQIAKSFGLPVDQEEVKDTTMTDQNSAQRLDALEQLLADTAAHNEAQRIEDEAKSAQVAKSTAVTADQLGVLFEGLLGKIDEKIAKATAPKEVEVVEETQVAKGLGRKSSIQAPANKSMTSREENPVAYIVGKARTPRENGQPAHTGFDMTDKVLIMELTRKYLETGMVVDNGHIDLDNL